MNTKEIVIDEEIHELLYVDYFRDRPSEAITAYRVPYPGIVAYRRLAYWDFFFNMNDKRDLMYFRYRDGGSIEDGIDAPKFIKGKGKHKIWKSDGIAFTGTPENVTVLEKPVRQNPFLHAEESAGYTCCEVCGTCADDWCWDCELPCGHAVWDDEKGCLKYI